MPTRQQILRYPFSIEARKESQRLARDIRSLIGVLSDPSSEYVIEAAEQRILAALDQKGVSTVITNDDRDYLIYPTSRLIVEKINNPRLKEYQAEAESKAVNAHLGSEDQGHVMQLCRESLEWDVQTTGTIRQRSNQPIMLRGYDFKIRYENYLEVAPSFHQAVWKLVNRHVDAGWVPIKRSELNRLISGKFKQLILNSWYDVPTLPQRLTEAVQRIESDLSGKIKRTEPVRITGQVVTAFPPCIQLMHQDSIQGKNLSHEARFALASFLLKIGMSSEEVVRVFRPAPDFARGLAEYQVEHIARKAGGEGYTPPACSKLQGNSLCPVYDGRMTDPLCEYILHPLAFYETRAWEMSKEIVDHSWYKAKKRRRQRF
jgi:DNA primase large subunit